MTPHPFGSLPHKDLVTLNDYSCLLYTSDAADE